jgi:IS605 OrfB family transposase
MKYQIIKPLDIDWNLFSDILYNLQNETRNIKNKTSQLCWEYMGFSSEYKEKNGEYPKDREILNQASIKNYAYNKLKHKYNKGNSNNRDTSIKDTTDKWRSDKADILRGNKLPPIYKKNIPIDLKNNSIRIIKDNGEYYFDISLLSNKYKKELGLKSGRISVLINARDKTQKTILDRILSGEYTISASKIKRIQKGKSKWMVYLAYKFEPKKEELDKNNIMGIDLGIINSVYMAFNNSYNRYKIEGGEIEHFKKQVESRKNQLYRQGKYCGEGRIGHGIKTRIKPIKNIKNKIANFRDTTNHKYSRYIVDMAIKHKCGTIQMEDLSGINKDNIFLKNWSYYDLQEKIKYKAEEVGIKVIKISPKYTSQRCSKCGHIHKENRESQSKFVCQECGFTTNADYNAAKNIATQDIEDIIKEEIKQ